MARTKKEQAIIDYKKEFNKQHYRLFKFYADVSKDKDIVDWLESKDNITGYLKNIIREDMKR